MFEEYFADTCAENFRSCRWGMRVTVKHAHTGSKDFHRQEWKFDPCFVTIVRFPSIIYDTIGNEVRFILDGKFIHLVILLVNSRVPPWILIQRIDLGLAQVLLRNCQESFLVHDHQVVPDTFQLLGPSGQEVKS